METEQVMGVVGPVVWVPEVSVEQLAAQALAQAVRAMCVEGVGARAVALMHEAMAPRGVAMLETSVRLGCSPATITQVVDRLEARDLVRRTRAGDDRRKWILRTTEEGRAMLERIAGAMRG